MITSLDPSKCDSIARSLGLGPGEPLRDLGRVVVLAGPNGSGKSRFLSLLQQVVEGTNRAWPLLQPHLDSLIERLDNGGFADAPAPHRPSRRDVQALVALSWRGKESHLPPTLIQMTLPRNTLQVDVRSQVESQLKGSVAECARPGLSGAYSHEHSFLVRAARYLSFANHPNLAQKQEYQTHLQEAREFCRILHALLGTQLGWDLGDTGSVTPRLYGRDFLHAELSEGQRILIGWAIVLHQQRAALKNGVAVIDEPENHLHPDACIQAIQRLRDDVLGSEGQVWLATHSIPLIAWAGTESLYAMEQGNIAFAGNRIAQVVETLAGGADGRERLQAFLSDADQLGFWNFVAQCLVEPSAAALAAEDPQTGSIAGVVGKLLEKKEFLRILDFGAGRGRLADALARAYAGKPDVLKRIVYFSYDPSDEHAEERTAHTNALYAAQAKGKMLGDDLRELKLPGAKVDVVIMCNVLHEIEPRQWLKAFQDCHEVLDADGSLLVIEDQVIPVGELPSDKGFIVLDAIEMRALFGGPNSVRDLSESVPAPFRGRISALEVPAVHVNACTRDSRSAALKLVVERATGEVKKARARAGNGTSQRDGRLHALHAMLWVNATLALEEV